MVWKCIVAATDAATAAGAVRRGASYSSANANAAIIIAHILNPKRANTSRIRPY